MQWAIYPRAKLWKSLGRLLQLLNMFWILGYSPNGIRQNDGG